MDDCHPDVTILGKSIVDGLARRWVFLVVFYFLDLLNYHLFRLWKIEAFVDVFCIDEETQLEWVEVVWLALELVSFSLDGFEEEIAKG